MAARRWSDPRRAAPTPAQIGALARRAAHEGRDGRRARRRGARAARARGRRCPARRRAPSTPAAPAATARGTFNISTAAALVVGGARACRSPSTATAPMSGRVGSADVLEALGVRDRPRRPAASARCLRRGRHRVPVRARASTRRMRHVAPVAPRARRAHDLQPARPAHQSGRRRAARWSACSRRALARAAGARRSRRLGSERALVVHGDDGLDELGARRRRRRWPSSRDGARAHATRVRSRRRRASRRRRTPALARRRRRPSRRRASAPCSAGEPGPGARHRAAERRRGAVRRRARRATCATGVARGRAQSIDSGARARALARLARVHERDGGAAAR